MSLMTELLTFAISSSVVDITRNLVHSLPDLTFGLELPNNSQLDVNQGYLLAKPLTYYA